MNQKSKRLSYSLLIFIVFVIFTSFAFLSYVFYKAESTKSDINVVQVEAVDSSLLIRQRDLIIESLNKDNLRLKEMYDQKHDTVFVPKIRYRVREEAKPIDVDVWKSDN